GIAAVFAREQAAGDRAPDEDAETLVDRDRDEFVFSLARLQSVMDLLGNEALVIVALGDVERLHDVPAGIIGAADIADLALLHEGIEGLHRLLERGRAVPLMHLVEVDMIGPETLEAGFRLLDDMPAREAPIVRPLAHREADFGRDERAIAPAV